MAVRRLLDRRIILLAVVAVLASTMPVSIWLFAPVDRSAGSVEESRLDGRATRGGRVGRTCAGKPLEAPHELRGMWLTTVNNIDWPSRPGLDAEAVQAELRGWLDLAQRVNHNAIFVHVRPSGDALWPSGYAPWSEWLTGKRDGQSPGWDPLEFMVTESHARNLEFHAWFNPYRGSQPAPAGAGPDVNQLAPDHPLRQHPDWQVVYPVNAPGSRLYFNPGIPEARKFVEDSILDAVSRYDIDGVHFDDFFYPYPAAGQDFPDDATFAQYGRGFADKGDWRRDNVNRFVQEMSVRIKELKPWVKFGISPFGIWRNSSNDPLGSPTRGLQSYDEISADTRLWVRREWLDYIVPQVYWHIGFEVADYAKLVPWWVEVTGGTRVQLYVGQADYRVGQPGAWSDPSELERQLTFNRRYFNQGYLNRGYAVSGSVHFSAKSVRDDKLGSVTRYRAMHYAGPALVPPMARLPSNPPAAPTGVTSHRSTDSTVTLKWRGNAASYAVYRVAGAAVRLVGTARGDSWTGQHTGAATYCVTALDRSWNEGAPSAPVTDSP